MGDDPRKVTFQPLAEAENLLETLFAWSFGLNVMLKFGLVLDCVFASRRSAHRSCACGREIRASYCVCGY